MKFRLVEDTSSDEQLLEVQSSIKRRVNSLMKTFASKRLGVNLHSGATVHHLKSSHSEVFKPFMREKDKSSTPTDDEMIKALDYVAILDAGSEKNNTAFNDVVHRLIDFTNGKNGNFTNLDDLFNLIKKANVYYFDNGKVIHTTFENVVGSDKFHFDKEEFNK